jgi:hypothetical protein
MGAIEDYADKLRMGYSEEQLHAAFDLVKDKENWKMPIDGAVIPEDQEDVVTAALIFFAGSPAQFEPIRERPGFLRVYAAGYYACIGA